MSLEKEIAELNITIQRLIAVLQNNAERAPVVQQVAAPEREEAAESQETERPTVDEKVYQFSDVQQALLAHVKTHGRESAVAIMNSFGVVGKLTEDKLPVDKYAAFIGACNG